MTDRVAGVATLGASVPKVDVKRILGPLTAVSLGTALLLGATILFATPARAASMEYILDQANALPDGAPYLSVTVADGADGAIDFTVQTLEALTSIADGNFGIQRFSFNIVGATAGEVSIVGLPDGWSVKGGKTHSEFGRFDASLFGTGNSRQSVLTFSVMGVEGDSILDYVDESLVKGAKDSQFFAAHVAGFAFVGDKKKMIVETSAHFAGSTQTVVPVPAAAGMFATALGLLGFLRRRISLRLTELTVATPGTPT